MATRATLVLAFLCLLVLQGVCVSGHHGHFHEKPAQNRKMMLKADLKENDGSKSTGWELRAVPSGPDPLHHNRGSPKKPRTDP